MWKVLFLSLLCAITSAQAMNYSPSPPPTAAQRATIAKLAQGQGLRCVGGPDSFLMEIVTPPPYPVSRVKGDEASWKAHSESVVFEGWRDKYALLDVERQPTFHRYHYSQLGSNGHETQRYYVVHTYHLKGKQVVKTVDSRCELK